MRFREVLVESTNSLNKNQGSNRSQKKLSTIVFQTQGSTGPHGHGGRRCCSPLSMKLQKQLRLSLSECYEEACASCPVIADRNFAAERIE